MVFLRLENDRVWFQIVPTGVEQTVSLKIEDGKGTVLLKSLWRVLKLNFLSKFDRSVSV